MGQPVRRLVYLAPVELDSPSQRPHHFVHWAHQTLDCDVVWVDPNPTRLPRWSDWRRMGRFVPQHLGPAWSGEPWVKRLKLSALPLEPLTTGRLVNGWIQRHSLRQIQAWLDQEDCWLVIGRPSSLGLQLCRSVKGRRVLYDVMDNTPEFSSGASARWMNRAHQAITRLAGHLWCSSLRLQEQVLTSTDREATLVRNGSGVMLGASQALPSGPPWVLGYVGTIADWFDWDHVIQLALQVPAVQLRLYGPMSVGRPHKLPANVQCLPAVPHDEIANLMAQWHAGLIPFKKNKLTDGVDPVKYYEYRACGLAVLSTRFGDMSQHQDDEGVWFLEDMPLTTLLDRLSRWWTKPRQERVRTDSGWANNFAQGATELGWVQPYSSRGAIRQLL